MSGCYGDSEEDRYFENKLLDHLEKGEIMSNEKWDELDVDLMEKLTNYMNDNKIDDEVFQILEDLILPIIDTLIEHDVLTSANLDNSLNELRAANNKLDQIAYLSENILGLSDTINNLSKE